MFNDENENTALRKGLERKVVSGAPVMKKANTPSFEIEMGDQRKKEATRKPHPVYLTNEEWTDIQAIIKRSKDFKSFSSLMHYLISETIKANK